MSGLLRHHTAEPGAGSCCPVTPASAEANVAHRAEVRVGGHPSCAPAVVVRAGQGCPVSCAAVGSVSGPLVVDLPSTQEVEHPLLRHLAWPQQEVAGGPVDVCADQVGPAELLCQDADAPPGCACGASEPVGTPLIANQRPTLRDMVNERPQRPVSRFTCRRCVRRQGWSDLPSGLSRRSRGWAMPA